ncbi:hypothetical protein NC652_012464 [Populus alba x Populus x berolinensis]|nr:hypothetical protein NC652_012464 [Populus alba x Populus x berolinensis]
MSSCPSIFQTTTMMFYTKPGIS